MPEKIKILFTGDLMLGEWHFCQGFGISNLAKKGNLSKFFDPVKNYFDQTDLVIGNLEGPVGKTAESVKKPLLVNENFIPALKEAGFAVISVANNHFMEYGNEGAQYSLDALNKSGLEIAGLAESPSTVITIGDQSIEIICADILPAHHERKDYPAESMMFSGRLEHIGEIVCDRLDFSEADYRLVYLHWGEEFMSYPCPLQVRWAHRFIEHGADAVVGSHPHVPQCVEKFRGKIIAYSLGNFISDMPYPITKKGYMLSVEFYEEGKFDFEIIPYTIDKKFTPIPMNEADKSEFLKFLNGELSKMEIKEDFVADFQAYSAEALNAENEMWDWVKGFYRRNMLKYPISVHWGLIKEKLGI